MEYNTFTPNELLAAFIKCYWTLEAHATTVPERQRIVPDGCMEMIFHYGDPYKQYTSDTDFIIQPSCFVFGQITTPLAIEPTGRTGIFSVRFHPDGFMPFATLPIKELENRAVPLEDLFGSKGIELGLEMIGAAGTAERITMAESFLTQQLATPRAIDCVAKQSVAVMLQLNGQVSVEGLVDQLQINRRQLERRFAATIGLSPKQLAKIIRLQATIKMLEHKQFSSLTELAYENGYFDQTHFIKDFREFTGVSPRQFYNSNLKMTSLFSSSD